MKPKYDIKLQIIFGAIHTMHCTATKINCVSASSMSMQRSIIYDISMCRGSQGGKLKRARGVRL